MYERIIQKALNTPWALHPHKLAVVQDILRFRATGQRLSIEDIRARIGMDDDEERPKPRQAGNIAVLPIHGVIANRAFEASSGATSTEWIGAIFRRLVANDDVAAIVLDFSSPGGTVTGVPELAAEIFAARAVKPIVAHVYGLAASAGYWLASQCSEISSIPTGEVGSIGVYSLHEDYSEYLKKEGIKITAIQAGEHKLDGAPWEPLSEAALAHFQAQVDACYADFLGAVSRGRDVSVADVKANYGQGWCFEAKKAKKLGMIDRIETLEQLVTRLSSGGRRRGGDRRAQASSPLTFHAIDETVDHDSADLRDCLTAAADDAPAAPAVAPAARTEELSAPPVPEPNLVPDEQVAADRDRARAALAIARAAGA